MSQALSVHAAASGRQQIFDFLYRWGMLLTVVALVAVFGLASDSFLDPNNIINILRSIAIVTVIAIGVSISLTIGGFDLSVGSTASLANALVITLALCTLVGLFNAFLIVILRIPDMLATLASLFVIQGVAMTYSYGGSITENMVLPSGDMAEGTIPAAFSLLGQVPTIVIVMLVVTVLAAFAFSRLNFRGKNLAFVIFLSLMMIPNELVIITNFVTVTNLDLRNTFMGLILPSVTSVFYIYLLKENFAQIPDELYYAAKVDGTSDMKYLLKVMVPICRPTLVTITILKVIECWNSYVWPRLITDDEAYFLVSNGIQTIRESGFGRENIPAMMAAVVAISVPLIVLFLIFRKKIMAGVARGGTKG